MIIFAFESWVRYALLSSNKCIWFISHIHLFGSDEWTRQLVSRAIRIMTKDYLLSISKFYKLTLLQICNVIDRPFSNVNDYKHVWICLKMTVGSVHVFCFSRGVGGFNFMVIVLSWSLHLIALANGLRTVEVFTTYFVHNDLNFSD